MEPSRNKIEINLWEFTAEKHWKFSCCYCCGCFSPREETPLCARCAIHHSEVYLSDFFPIYFCFFTSLRPFLLNFVINLASSEKKNSDLVFTALRNNWEEVFWGPKMREPSFLLAFIASVFYIRRGHFYWSRKTKAKFELFDFATCKQMVPV